MTVGLNHCKEFDFNTNLMPSSGTVRRAEPLDITKIPSAERYFPLKKKKFLEWLSVDCVLVSLLDQR